MCHIVRCVFGHICCGGPSQDFTPARFRQYYEMVSESGWASSHSGKYTILGQFIREFIRDTDMPHMESHIKSLYNQRRNSCHMHLKYVRYGKSYRGCSYCMYKIRLYVIVYAKYGHCIEMLFICQKLTYKWCLQQCPHVVYTIAYKDYLYTTVWRIKSISMQCPYLAYTITYN